MKRDDTIKKLQENQEWDFVVIGGGASGLGAALDATTRGFKTLLLEAYDFSKGTSSRSTKLVHGGVRYLAQGDVGLVREALHERGLLSKNASHLFKNQSFVIPNYSKFDGYFYTIGLKMYDLLAGGLSLGSTKFVGRKKTIEKLPTIEQKGLACGVVYQDGQFDDARLAINLAQTIEENGGSVANYTKVVGLLKDAGKVVGVEVLDVLSQEKYKIKAKVVVNATGVFTNDILNMNDASHGKFVVPSQGIHLVLDRSFLPGGDALMIPKTSDGRVLFAVPWHNVVVVGTTDTPLEDPSFEPRPLEKEIDFVLETAQRYLTKKPTREDVLSVFAGLRPLAAPKKQGAKTKEVSRSHKVITSQTGLVTITGGKWTTYRKMAEDTIDVALKLHKMEQRPCNTKTLHIHGNIPAEKVDLKNYLYVYGSDMQGIKKLEEENTQYGEKIHPKHPYTVAQIIWAIREEMAQNVDDVLSRRVRLLYCDARASIDCAEKVAKIMAKEMGKDSTWVETQTKQFIEMAKGYLLVDYNPKAM